MKKGKKRMGHLSLFLAALGLVFLLLMGIFSDWGLMDLIQTRKEKAGIIAANAKIKAENQILARKIYRLKNDREYIEKIVRQELGVVKDGELIIKIPPVRVKNGTGQ